MAVQSGPYTVSPGITKNKESLLVNASLWRRGFNFAVDIVIINLIESFLLPAIWLLGVERRFVSELTYELLTGGTPQFFYLVLVLYYVLFDGVIGRTPGKMLTSTYLVGGDEQRPGFWRAVLRSICRVIPFNYLSIFLSVDRRCWHDQVSGTRVVVKV